MRKENLAAIDDLCISCKTTKVAYQEEWHLNTLYKIGVCNNCEYEHHEEIKRI